MYTKVVTLFVLFIAFSTVGYAGSFHNTYYTGPMAYSYGSAYGYTQNSAFNFDYVGMSQRPVFTVPQRSPSSFNFAYTGLNRAPVLETPQRSPSTVNINAQPMDFTPDFSRSVSPSSFRFDAFTPIQPNLGQSRSFGNINLNLQARQIPLGSGGFFGGAYHFSYSRPIYATPSRALFDTQAEFGFYGPYYHEAPSIYG